MGETRSIGVDTCPPILLLICSIVCVSTRVPFVLYLLSMTMSPYKYFVMNTIDTKVKWERTDVFIFNVEKKFCTKVITGPRKNVPYEEKPSEKG